MDFSTQLLNPGFQLVIASLYAILLALAGHALLPGCGIGSLSVSLRLALCIMAALAGDVALVTISGSFLVGFYALLGMALVGTLSLVRALSKGAWAGWRTLFVIERWRLIGALLLFGALVARSASMPVLHCDFLKNWAFHGVVLAYEGSFKGTFIDPFYMARFHMDYPPAMAVLMAQLFQLLPADGNLGRPLMAVLLLPLLLGVTTLAPRGRVAALAWYFLLIIPSGYLLVSGVVDQHLCLCGICALLLLLLWDERGDSRYLSVSLCYVLYGLILKNDGIIFLGSWSITLLYLGWRRLKNFPNLLKHSAATTTALLLLSAVVCWSWIKYRNGLSCDLKVDRFFLARAYERLTDVPFQLSLLGGSISGLLGAVVSAWVVGMVAGFTGIPGRYHRGQVAILISAATYLGALALIYLGTPYSLRWHLLTSIARTTLFPQHLAYLFALFAVTGPYHLQDNEKQSAH